jgi:hypothetical protein
MSPSLGETNCWQKRLSASEEMIAQMVIVMHKNLGAQVTLEETKKNEEPPMVPIIQIKKTL